MEGFTRDCQHVIDNSQRLICGGKGSVPLGGAQVKVNTPGKGAEVKEMFF